MPTDLTVLVPSFNHERYIASALESVLAQTAISRAIVVVSDDCSSDRTEEVARRSAEGHPNVRVQKTPRNLGVMPHYKALAAGLDTEFVAILEGDDHWINVRKLELQLKALERYPQADGSFTACLVHDEKNGREWAMPSWGGGRSSLVPFVDLLSDNPIATFSNCLYRSGAFIDALSRAETGYDWLVNLLVATTGGLAFVGTVSTIYQVHAGGAWSGKTSAEKKALTRQTLEALRKQVRGFNLLHVEDAIARSPQ